MKKGKIKFKESQLRSLSDFFVNIATAWFVGGLVTPFFTKPPLTQDLILDILFAVLSAALFMYLSLWVLR